MTTQHAHFLLAAASVLLNTRPPTPPPPAAPSEPPKETSPCYKLRVRRRCVSVGVHGPPRRGEIPILRKTLNDNAAEVHSGKSDGAVVRRVKVLSAYRFIGEETTKFLPLHLA